jgi:DNA-binding MarR family transcriptional regulator
MSASHTKTIAAGLAFCESFAAATGDATMGLQQVRLLLSLYVHGTLNQNDLPRHTGVQKSSNGRNIDRLGPGSFREPGLGYIESYEDPRDRRYKLVRLTPRGRAVLEETAAALSS